MKKKILFTVFVSVLFVLALAMCAGATTIYRDSEGNELFRFEMDENSIITTYQGEFPKTNSEGEALTWYVTGTATEGENTIKTVASILTFDENHVTFSNGVYSYKGNTVKNTNVVSVYFPSDKGITKINLQNGGYRSANVYTYTPNSSEILFIYLPSTLTELPERIGQATKILVCDIPFDAQITKISHVLFHSSKCLREINIPDTVTEISGQGERNGSAFFECASLERVNFTENSQLKTIGIYAFHKNYKLREVKIPDSVTFVGSHAFSYTALIESPFSEKSLCEELGGRCFGNIATLKSFIVPTTLKKAEILGTNDYGPLAESKVELVTFGNASPITELLPSFFARAGIKKIVLPNGPTSIPSRFFLNATMTDVCLPDTIVTVGEFAFEGATVEVIRLGANFEYFTNNTSANHRMTNVVKGLKAIYLPVSFYAEKPSTVQQVAYAFDVGGAKNIKFFYTGTQEQLAQAIINFKEGTKDATVGNGAFLGAKQISYGEYCLDMTAYESGSYIIFGYDPCQAFCEPFIDEDTVIESTITYESYLESGIRGEVCPICGTATEGEVVPALFICYGYSVPENGFGGIVIKYDINREAIDVYVKETGKSISYGLFAALYSKIGESDAVLVNGQGAEGVIAAEISGFDVMEIKLKGFQTEEQKNAAVVLGAYVIATKDESTTVSYLQAQKPIEGEKYSCFVFNEFINEQKQPL